LEAPRLVTHDARLGPHHSVSSEHIVTLRRTFYREHLHGPRGWSRGSGLRRGVDGLGATALSGGRCGGRRGGGTAACRVEVDLILEFDMLARAGDRLLDQLTPSGFVLELEVGARPGEIGRRPERGVGSSAIEGRREWM